MKTLILRRERGTARRAGFTLIEVLVAMVIVAIAVFPCLEVIREAQKNSFDAKFAELCASRMRSLLSEIARTQKPGTSSQGDLSTMSKDEGGDDRLAYANIRYEWQCSAVDLSLDVAPAADLSDDAKKAEDDKRKKQEDAQKGEDADSSIDERFRGRYVRMTCTYNLDNGEERQIIVETYVPPLPSADKNKDGGAGDLVAPNKGTGAGGSTKGGTNTKPGGAGKGGTTAPGKGSAGKGGGGARGSTSSGNPVKGGN